MSTLVNWIPYKLSYQDNDWQLLWLDLQEKHIEEPFFDETIRFCRLRMKERSEYIPASSLDFLIEAAKDVDSIAPGAFIFHVSRCGSTLLSQALATAETNIVYPEAPLIDEILRMQEQDPAITAEQQELWFKSAVALMGQKRKAGYEQLFIKLDSWHIHFYSLLRKWYPDTPFFFLSREPNAVIASHHHRRGMQAVPGMINSEILKIDIQERHNQDFNLFTAEVIAGYYRALQEIITVSDPNNTFFDYGWGVKSLLICFFKSVMQEDSVDDKPELKNYAVAEAAYKSLLRHLVAIKIQ